MAVRSKSERFFVAIKRGRNTHVSPVNSRSTKVAVIGASGYAGEELVRLLLQHPLVELTAVTSRQYAGRSLAEIYPRFAHLPKAQKLTFSELDAANVSRASDIVFLALPHGVSAETAVDFVRLGTKIIDLSADFRLRDEQVYSEFYGKKHAAPELLKDAVYGLPELYRERIKNGSLIACPGCYPTSILLPLAPLLETRAIDPARIIVASLSGVTGAGRKTEAEYLSPSATTVCARTAFRNIGISRKSSRKLPPLPAIAWRCNSRRTWCRSIAGLFRQFTPT